MKIKLSELADVIMGQSPPSSFYNDSGEGVPFFQGKTEFGELYPTVEKFTQKITKEAKEGDILFTVRAPVGEVNISNVNCCIGRGLAAIRPKEDNNYLFYKIQHEKARFVSKSSGVIYDSINKDILNEVELTVEESQSARERIGTILWSYDSLIINNLQRIELLEESAQILYREWFVHLRFPGHEHTKITNGVPKEWERKILSELTDIIDYGYTASANQEDVGPKFLRITDIVPASINWVSVPFCKIEEKRKNKYLLREGDVVVARTGATVGYAKRIHKRNPESVFASYLVRFRFKQNVDNIAMGVFMESDEYKNYVKSHVGGAAQPNANAKILAGAKVLLPERKIRDMFKSIIAPIIDQKEILQVSNQVLIKARDILLPRLMNGDIAV